MKKKFFDDSAHSWSVPEGEKLLVLQEKIIPLLELKSGEKLLDVCGGPGVLIPLLKSMKVHITECDYSEKMIEKAKKLYAGLAEFVVGSIEKMPFKDKSFDKIICNNSFPHIENKQKAFNESFRVLKEKGIFLISHNASKNEIDAHHRQCHQAVKNDMIPSNDEIISFAAKSGFESVEILDEEKFFAVICRK